MKDDELVEKMEAAVRQGFGMRTALAVARREIEMDVLIRAHKYLDAHLENRTACVVLREFGLSEGYNILQRIFLNEATKTEERG